MTDGGNHFALLHIAAQGILQGNVSWEVKQGAVPAGDEDRIEIVWVDRIEPDRILESLTRFGRFTRLLRAGFATWINRSCPSTWAGYSYLKTIGSELLVWDGKLSDPCWMIRVKMIVVRDYHQDSVQPCHRLALLSVFSTPLRNNLRNYYLYC